MNRPADYIIIRFVEGNASEDELREVSSWVEESEDNARELFQLEAAWHRLEAQKMPAAQMEQALRRVMAHPLQNGEPRQVRMVGMRRWLRYAAAVVVLLVGGALVWQLHFAPSRQPMMLAQAVESTQEIVLTDGTHVWLNKGARLRYPEHFVGNERNVELDGEGYFEVAKDSLHPFIVSNKVMTVKVLGTKFNFKADAEHQVGEISLIEGSVGVRNSRISDMVVLMPGQKAEIDQKTGMLRVSEVNTRLAAIWHDDLIPFENASIVEIARTLEQVYGVKVVLASGLDLQRTYSGSIQRKKDIDSVLRALCNTVPVRYRITNQTITLSGQ